MARDTSIEAVAVVPAGPDAVWTALLDQERWREWEHGQARVRLADVELLDPTFARVGDRRRCSAQLTRPPLLGKRRITWEELVTDVDPGRTLEVEALHGRTAVRRWRMRFWLVPQAEHETRLRCRVTYRPHALGGWLADQLILRKRIAETAEAWLSTLAASFTPAVSEEVLEAPSMQETAPAVDVYSDADPVAA
jgi:hypothetical protein